MQQYHFTVRVFPKQSNRTQDWLSDGSESITILIESNEYVTLYDVYLYTCPVPFIRLSLTFLFFSIDRWNVAKIK